MNTLIDEESTLTNNPIYRRMNIAHLGDPKRIFFKGYASFAGITHTLQEIIHTLRKERELPSSWLMQ